MSSVSLDIFSLPSVNWRGNKYDSLVLCVDRLSGWIIATPTTKVGLTAEKAAHLILENGWDIFGIPAVITSDRGPQFVGQWWRTMCARVGIRHAFSQAYRPQANGRAEIAGKTLKNLMRKVWEEHAINWVEALPRILRMYHDMPGESGHSPFQIMFGRDRHLPGVPLPLAHECEEATQFFDRMKDLDRKVSDLLNAQHATEINRANASRVARAPLKPGDWVWVLRPKAGVATKLDSWWVGPVPVQRRTGDASYEVLLKPGTPHAVHMDQLKPFVTGESVNLYHYAPGYRTEGTTQNEWNVDAILDHRIEHGKLQFLTRWEGFEQGPCTWEPVGNFIHRYSWKLPQYCKEHKLRINLTDYLRDSPSDDEVEE